MEQRGGRVHAFGERPVHAVMHDRLALPIGRVDDARGAVGVPRVFDRAVEQMLGGVEVLAPVAVQHTALAVHRKRVLRDQARPLNAMARRSAVRLELVVRLVRVELEQRLPVGVEMLGDAPVVLLGPREHMADNPAGALTPAVVAGHVGHGEAGLDRVHVRVEAAVGVELGELGVPCVDAQADLVIPEARQVHVLRLVEQLARARAAREQRRRRREQHERVRVRLLAGHVADARGDLRVPAVVLVVVQRAAQAAHAVVDELGGAVYAHQRGERVDVRHAAGDPRGAVAVRPRRAVVAKPVRTAVDRRKTPPERDEVVSRKVEEPLVLRRTDLVLGVLRMLGAVHCHDFLPVSSLTV